MKIYNKPSILIEEILTEDILAVSKGDAFDFDNSPGGSSSTFDDLWN